MKISFVSGGGERNGELERYTNCIKYRKGYFHRIITFTRVYNLINRTSPSVFFNYFYRGQRQ